MYHGGGKVGDSDFEATEKHSEKLDIHASRAWMRVGYKTLPGLIIFLGAGKGTI